MTPKKLETFVGSYKIRQKTNTKAINNTNHQRGLSGNDLGPRVLEKRSISTITLHIK